MGALFLESPPRCIVFLAFPRLLAVSDRPHVFPSFSTLFRVAAPFKVEPNSITESVLDLLIPSFRVPRIRVSPSLLLWVPQSDR